MIVVPLLCQSFASIESIPEEKKFDAILVDEGQDFNANFWLAIRTLLKENSKCMYVALDPIQQIRKEKKRKILLI